MTHTARNNLTVAELAERWACGRDSVYGMIQRGELPAFRLGGKLLRVKLEAVEQWESDGGIIRLAPIDSGSSKDKPSQHGGTPRASTATG